MHIDHINISAPFELLQKVRDFYCQVFGLVDGFRPQFSKRGFWLYAEDKPIIHLFESSEHHHNEKQGYFDHVAFQTTGLDSVLEKLDSELPPEWAPLIQAIAKVVSNPKDHHNLDSFDAWSKLESEELNGDWTEVGRLLSHAP